MGHSSAFWVRCSGGTCETFSCLGIQRVRGGCDVLRAGRGHRASHGCDVGGRQPSRGHRGCRGRPLGHGGGGAGSAALNAGGSAWVSSVSCVPAGNCAAGGNYSPASGNVQAFVDETQTSPTSTSISLSAAKVTYGDEQAEHVPVTVTSPGGTPGGTVAVKSGTSTICTITLRSGRGQCSLAARQFRTGIHTLIAVYNGNSNFTGSASSRKTLMVVQ
jgi:hypothetical protein